MKRQRERFLQVHEQDDFVREYMEAMCHHEIGKGLKPVNFDGWLDGDPGSPDDLAFWLRYWIAAYRFVLEHADDNSVLLSYARLTEEPSATLSGLANALGLPPESLSSQADKLQPPRTHSENQEQLSDALYRKANDIYDQLSRNAPA